MPPSSSSRARWQEDRTTRVRWLRTCSVCTTLTHRASCSRSSSQLRKSCTVAATRQRLELRWRSRRALSESNKCANRKRICRSKASRITRRRSSERPKNRRSMPGIKSTWRSRNKSSTYRCLKLKKLKERARPSAKPRRSKKRALRPTLPKRKRKFKISAMRK